LTIARRIAPAVFSLFAFPVLAACGATPMRVAALDDLERVRGSALAREGAEKSPQAYARAEQERIVALRAHAAGDDAAATLHAERAVAAYQHALVIARLAKAAVELADAQKALDDVSAQRQSLEASRGKLDQDAADLEQRAQIARERLLPAASAAASAEREAARLTAARSLAVEARLLCGAAQLASTDAAGAADAQDALAKLEQRLDKSPRPAPIDDAAGARAQCLDVLTRARRAAADEGSNSDALLAEISASGGWDPSRDERGVVVVLRGLFHGVELTDAGAARLKDLGRIAGAHPNFGLQVVVHDTQQPNAKDDSDAKRAQAVVKALVAGGASESRAKSELAGARAPVVDPADPKLKTRNERVEVVFVAAGK
jgi:flagellar motor protein MotB